MLNHTKPFALTIAALLILTLTPGTPAEARHPEPPKALSDPQSATPALSALNGAPATSAGQAEAENVAFLGQIGGSANAVAVQGSYAYVGQGPRLIILDISNPSAPTVVGRTAPFFAVVQDVCVSNGAAYVAADWAGLRVIDVSDPAHPTELGSDSTQVWAQGVTVSGSIAYVVGTYSGLRLFDVSDPAHPTELGSWGTPGQPQALAVSGTTAYVADGSGGLRVIDASDPVHPTELGSYDTPGYARGVAVSGTMAYVADGYEGVRVVDVGDPAHPAELGSYDAPGDAVDVAVSGGIAYVADDWGELRMVDVSDPAHPAELGSCDALSEPRDVHVSAGTAYVAGGSERVLQIVDVSNPATPASLGHYETVGLVSDVALSGGHAYLATGAMGSPGGGLRVVDVSDPAHLAEVGSCRFDVGQWFSGIALSGSHAYLVGGSPLHVVDVSSPAEPTQVGSCSLPPEGGDVAVSGSYAYAAGIFDRGLRVVDVSSPTDPTEVGSHPTPGWSEGVAVSGGIVYVADRSGGMRLFDVSDPAQPTELGSYTTPGDALDVAVSGGLAYVAAEWAGLRVIDVSDPAHPSELGSYDTPGRAQGVTIQGDIAYVADGSRGLCVVDVSDPAHPTEVGTYLTPGDAMGVAISGTTVHVAGRDGGLITLRYEEPGDEPTAIGEPGLSFRYVESFGEPQTAYFARTDYLNGPNGLFIDGDDDLYVAEELGARILKYRTSAGGPNLLSIGVAGLQDEGEYTFNHPQDVFVDSSGDIWTVDQHRVAQYDAGGTFQQQVPPDDPWNSGNDNTHFDGPKGIAFDSGGRLYVADSYNHRIQVYTLDLDGTPVYSTTIGVTDTPGADNAHFNKPAQIVFDSSDRLYVTDVDNYRVQRCIYSGGWMCQPFHGTGAPGSGDAQLNLAYGIGIDHGDNIYIGDGINARVKKCTAAGSCTTFATAAGWPADVAVDSEGHVYVADYYDHTIRAYDSGGTEVGIFKGIHDTPYLTDDGHFNAPYGVAVDGLGNLFLTEYAGHRLIKLNAQGTPQWSVGEPGVFGGDDEHFGGLWDGPGAVAVDSDGNAYVADTDNHRVQKCTPGGQCTLFAGVPGEPSSDPDHLEDPFGVAVDADGNVYVAEQDNHRVQKCTPEGDCEIFAGVTDEIGDDDSHFNHPMGVAVDATGNVYVADAWNHRVQRCAPTGSCSTFAGTTGSWGEGFDHFSEPRDVAVDAQGRVYVADIYNNRVQVFDGSGAYLTTIGGTWGSEVGRISHAPGVAVDAQGNVYVTDHVNHRIQKFAPGLPGWRQVNINGFGDWENFGAWSLGTFEGALYVSTSNPADGAEVYRLSSGSWERVVSGGFGDSGNVAVDRFAEFKGALYAGTWNGWSGSSGGQLWRSPTGDSGSWERVADDGFGDPTNGEIMSLTSFDGWLYAGTWSVDTGDHGAEIWRSPTGDIGSWARVASDGLDGDSDNGAILSFEVFNGYLYAVTANQYTGGEVWRTQNGTSWTQVNADGFGDPANIYVVSLEVFEDALYAGTWNYQDGSEIWRTTNGTGWDQVVGGGFDGVDNSDIASLVAFDGDLYAIVGNRETGPEVWLSPNGDSGTWRKVADTGFGLGPSEGVDWDNMTAVLNGSLYVGTFTWGNSGGRVWQRTHQVYLPLVLRGH